MSAAPGSGDARDPDWRRQRHEEARAAILAAAWELAGREGVAAISLRELARAVGMRAPSLYTYFDSKNAIYDAMFAAGWRLLLARAGATPLQAEPRAGLIEEARGFFAFCVEDPARYQLMFQRPMPDFEPSGQAYAHSLAAFQALRDRLAAYGIDDLDDVERWTFLMTGLTARQVANDPGGDRYAHHIDDLVDMFLTHVNR